MNEEQAKITEALEDQARTKRDFHEAWERGLVKRLQSLSKVPTNAVAYEIAWHAFKAGKESARVG